MCHRPLHQQTCFTYTEHLITSRSECYLSIWFAQHNLTSCLPFVLFMFFGILDCKDVYTYFMHILFSSSYTDKGSDISYKLTRCSLLREFMLDCTDIYQQRVVVDQYNKSGYIPNALKIIAYPVFLNVNKSFFSGYLEVGRWSRRLLAMSKSICFVNLNTHLF